MIIKKNFCDQSSGDSSKFVASTRHVDRANKKNQQDFIENQVQPGSTLATAIGERFSLDDRSTNRIDERNEFTLDSPDSSRISTRETEIRSHNERDNGFTARRNQRDFTRKLRFLSVKYKTELCRNYSAYGVCSYSSRCQFAHGQEELRHRTRHPKYKTEFCRNFLSGFCKYGSRCQFVHNVDDLKLISDSYPTTGSFNNKESVFVVLQLKFFRSFNETVDWNFTLLLVSNSLRGIDRDSHQQRISSSLFQTNNKSDLWPIIDRLFEMKGKLPSSTETEWHFFSARIRSLVQILIKI